MIYLKYITNLLILSAFISFVSCSEEDPSEEKNSGSNEIEIVQLHEKPIKVQSPENSNTLVGEKELTMLTSGCTCTDEGGKFRIKYRNKLGKGKDGSDSLELISMLIPDEDFATYTGTRIRLLEFEFKRLSNKYTESLLPGGYDGAVTISSNNGRVRVSLDLKLDVEYEPSGKTGSHKITRGFECSENKWKTN